MRRIEFRGQRIDNGEWAYGYYLQNLTKGEVRHYIFSRPSMMEVIPETVGQFTGLYDATKWEDLTERERGEWTLDGNMPGAWKGREIYEGDILSLVASNGMKINITCRFGSAHRTMKDTGALCDIVGFYFEHANGAKSFPMVCNYKGLHDTKIMEIIGNIHDNKERTFARITSYSDDEYTIEVDDRYYEEHEHSNLNQELLDEFCDFIEDNFPPDDIWDAGYRYFLFRNNEEPEDLLII